jgi:hypothetical protein
MTVTLAHQETIRSRVTFDKIEGLRITIRAQTNPIVLLLLLKYPLLAGPTTLGAGYLLRTRVDDPSALETSHRLLLCASICISFGFLVCAHKWWNGRCREIIQIDGDTLVLSAEGYLLTHRPKRTYLLSEVRNLRYEPSPLSLGDRNCPMCGLSIAFDYRASTRRFGLSLPQVESHSLIRTIKDRYKIADDKAKPLPFEWL